VRNSHVPGRLLAAFGAAVIVVALPRPGIVKQSSSRAVAATIRRWRWQTKSILASTFCRKWGSGRRVVVEIPDI